MHVQSICIIGNLPDISRTFFFKSFTFKVSDYLSKVLIAFGIKASYFFVLTDKEYPYEYHIYVNEMAIDIVTPLHNL